MNNEYLYIIVCVNMCDYKNEISIKGDCQVSSKKPFWFDDAHVTQYNLERNQFCWKFKIDVIFDFVLGDSTNTEKFLRRAIDARLKDMVEEEKIRLYKSLGV